MKYLFLLILAVLGIASFFTWRAVSGVDSPRPVIYWVTDANPAREDQIHLFHLWQVKHGHSVPFTLDSARKATDFVASQSRLFQRSLLEINPALKKVADGQAATLTYPLQITLPLAEMRLDTADPASPKQIIQCVSGVGDDVIDLYTGADTWQMQGMGLLEDLTDDAARMGFSPDQTFRTVLPDLTIPIAGKGRRQFRFPCNVTGIGYMVNLDCFSKVGMPPPPPRWTVEEMETYGREYVKRANAGLPRRQYFLLSELDQKSLRHSYGGSELNETMTAATFADPRSVAAVEKYLQWQDEDHLFPSDVDRAGFATDMGYGGQEAQLLNSGNYALMWCGRYLLIEFRKFNIERVKAGQTPLKLAVATPPYKIFPNTQVGTRAAGVYAGSKHKDLAILFLAFLASEDYNMQIVRDGDSEPPKPFYTQRVEYLRPKSDPAKGIYSESEDNVHGPFEDIAENLAVASSYSPFVPADVVDREENSAEDTIVNRLATPEAAFARADRRIDEEIQRNLTEDPRRRPLYDAKIAQQHQIDQMKQAIMAWLDANPGKPIPAELKIPAALLDNPFHAAFYLYEGWASKP